MSDQLIEAAVEDTVSDMKRWAADLWENRKPDTEAMKERMTSIILLALLAGVSTSDVQDEIDVAVKVGPGKIEYAEEPWWRIDGSPKTSRVFHEVIDLLMRKTPTLSVLSPKQLSMSLRQTAWFISGVTSRRLLDDIRKELVRVRATGGTQQDFIESVASLTDRSAGQIETVFRTNVASATGAARWKQYNDPDVADLFFGYQYVSKQDGRSRPLHRLMNGFASVKSDSIWRIIWRPNGYNCRCQVRPLRKHQAIEVGLMNEEGEVVKSRVYANQFQREIVNKAESGEAIMVDGRGVFFPDDGFQGNLLMDVA